MEFCFFVPDFFKGEIMWDANLRPVIYVAKEMYQVESRESD